MHTLKIQHEEMCIIMALYSLRSLPCDHDDAFGEEVNLVNWFHNTSARGATPEQILYTRLRMVPLAGGKKCLLLLRLHYYACSDEFAFWD